MRAAPAAALVLVLLAAACGAGVSRPGAASTPAAPPSGPAPSSPPGPLVVISDTMQSPHVLLAALDGVDTALVPGRFVQVVGNKVILLDGSRLESLDRDGTVSRLGAVDPQTMEEWPSPPPIVVSPDLKQWLYVELDPHFTASIHLASANADHVIATVPSPDQTDYFAPFAWNAGGAYMQLVRTGIGGYGPFLHYQFPVYRIDLGTGALAPVQPRCLGWAVLGDGTLLCDASDLQARQALLEIRPPTGTGREVAVGTLGTGGYSRLSVSPDGSEVVFARNARGGNVIEYQMATLHVAAGSWTPFGAVDFAPDAWLPDGRIVADHGCVLASPGYSAGSCDPGLDGTYVFRADGSSRTRLAKLAPGQQVVGTLS